MSPIIGKGEKTVLSVVKELFGENAYYQTQIQFKDLLSEEFYAEGLSERQKKESVDIVIWTLFDCVCVRVNGGDHTGVLKSQRDTVQKKMLEWSGNIVIDVWFYDCPTVFKEKLNDESRREVIEAFHGLI